MGKKLIYIVLGALLIFGLLFLLWTWIFGGSGIQTQTSGTFGEASSTNENLGTGSGGQTGNGEVGLGTTGGNTVTNQTINIGGGTSAGTGGSNTAGAGTGGTSQATLATLGTQGSTWLGGTGSASAGSGSAFNPSAINSISSGLNGSVPTILNPTNGSSGSNSSLDTLLGSGAIGVVSCAIRSGALATAAGTGGAEAGLGAVGVPVGGPALASLAGNSAAQTALQTGSQTTSFAGCIVNTLAKVALQQITVSVVNWINSGFNGQPAFITNYQQFFTNVADAAAGQFVQGTGLAFLCSPFQLQIKIAIAQSYANRGAQSCTLTGIIKNVNNFMSGSFAQGGWPGFVSFTTVPTNNPYGAYAYAQVGLASAQSSALSSAKNNISPTGFLNLQTLSGCNVASNNGISGGIGVGSNPQAAIAGGSASLPAGCKAKVTTPGGAIASSLDNTLGLGQDQLGLGNDLDQIFNALTTQLLTKSLYNGLSSLSDQTASIDTASQSADAALLADMQANISIAQQYGSIEQGSISDIETAQQNLNTLANCWSGVASTTSNSTQSSTAAQNAASAQAQLQTLNGQISIYNSNITNANNEIAELEQFVTGATTVGSAADVQSLSANYSAAKAAHPFISQTDLTTEQQNRTTLQAQMSALNQATAGSQTQCTAQSQ